ncbi:MAG: Hpt domain-containing protein [Myxococcales bacterium]|nr:Hpt domain-containing protein [Myxococcales bacterium]
MFLEALPEQIRHVRALASRVDANLEAATELRRIAHKLGGSGTTFGFPEISREGYLCSRAPDSDLPARADALLRTLDAVAGDPSP